jgi:hypothetical protein
MNPYVPRTIFTYFSPFHQNFGSLSTRVQSLMTEFELKSNLYNTETMFLPLGDDFTHSDAVTTFDYTDYYLSMWKSNPLRYENTSIEYITPSEYFKKLAMEPKIWSKTYGDFFPYADQGVAYWTGYYTTRPHFKREVKIFGQVFRAFKQIFSKVYSMRDNGYMSFLQFYMESVYVFFDDYGTELGIFNHHDAISGTSPENTIIDYRERKNKIIKTTTFYLSSILNDYAQFMVGEENKVKIIKYDDQQLPMIEFVNKTPGMQGLYREGNHVKAGTDEICNFQRGEVCQILNLAEDEAFMVKIYNPKNAAREMVRVQVFAGKKFEVIAATNAIIESEVICTPVFLPADSFIREPADKLNCLLYFVADLPDYDFGFYKIITAGPDTPESNPKISIIGARACEQLQFSDQLRVAVGCDPYNAN